MNAEIYAQKRIQEIDFDFHHFKLDDFVEWLQDHKQRKIHLIPVPSLGVGVYGRWISISDRPHEYIFYVESMPWFTKALTLCHELIHILEGHNTLCISIQELDSLFNTPFFAEQALARSTRTSYEDEVAETMASFLVHHMVKNKQTEKSINKLISSNHFLAEYLNTLGIT